MDDNLRKELSREKLNRLSSDFEVELLRLIKTLNLISQSKELFKNQVEEIQSISSNLKLSINDFTIKLLEIEKRAREDAGGSRKDFASPGPNTPVPDYDAIIKEVTRFRGMIDIADKDIENAKTEHLNRLDSFYSVYNLELKASQDELNSKLSHLKELFAEAPPLRVKDVAVSGQSPGGPEPAHTQGNGSGEPRKSAVPSTRDIQTAPPGEIFKPHASAIPKRNINLAHDTHYPGRVSFYSSGKLLMGIVFLFIGALVGITSFYLLNIMGGDETAPVAGVKTYTDAQITGSEEDHTLAVSDKESPSRSSRGGLAEKGIEGPLSAEANPDDTPAPDIRGSSVDGALVGGAASEYAHPDEPVGTAARGIAGIGTGNGGTTERADKSIGSDLYTVVGVGANIRSGPGINHSVATVVMEGERFESMGERRGIWIKVIAPDGTEGWVSKKVVRQLN